MFGILACGGSRCSGRRQVASPSRPQPKRLVNSGPHGCEGRSYLSGCSDKTTLSSKTVASVPQTLTALPDTRTSTPTTAHCKGNNYFEGPGQRTVTSHANDHAARSPTIKRQEATTVDFADGIRQLKLLVEPGHKLGGLSAFAKAYCDDDFCRRLLRKHDGDIQKSAGKLQIALQWREQHKELILSRKFVMGSDERVIGVDLEKRPVVYLCLKNQLLSSAQCMEQKFVCMLQAIDSMPDGVEKTVHIWDLHGQKFRMSDLNPAPIIEMMKGVEHYFVERLHEVIIIGMPRLAGLMKDAVWPLVPESTKSKTKFMSFDQAKQYLQQACDAEVYGRIALAMEQNRDNCISIEERRETWMQVDKSGALVPLAATSATIRHLMLQ